MTELNELFSIIKQQLRAQGLKYKDLAQTINLSETSVKRIFSQKDISISRLEEICKVLGLSLSETFILLNKRKTLIHHLSVEQEQELVNESALLLVAICILSYWTFEEILSFYAFSQHQLVQYAAHLDRMRIIELQSGNRFKLLVAPDFNWISSGPIQTFFQEIVQDDFFSCRFEKPNEYYMVRHGMLSEQDNQQFHQLLDKTSNEFIKRCRDTVDIPIDKRDGTALIIAMRPWVPYIFDKFKR